MTTSVFCLVLLAAILHSSWNAMLRAGNDRLWSMTLMMVSIFCVTSVGACFVSWPNKQSWPYIILSAFIHTLYNFSLVRAYQSGDFGETYPISRGISPLIISLAAILFINERININAILGILLISVGILSLVSQKKKFKPAYLPAAIATGILIAAYTVVDGIGVRLANDNLAYTNAMFFMWSLSMPILYFLMRNKVPNYTNGQIAVAMLGGVISIAAYGIVIWAMKYDAMGMVSALRESSVVFAVLLGRVFLREELTVWRLLSCFIIVSGAVLLAFG